MKVGQMARHVMRWDRRSHDHTPKRSGIECRAKRFERKSGARLASPIGSSGLSCGPATTFTSVLRHCGRGHAALAVSRFGEDQLKRTARAKKQLN